MRFDSYSLKHRPDQTVFKLNEIEQDLNGLKRSIRIVSDDNTKVIIIGNQPINPNTGKPYAFGIKQYQIKGDRLIELS